MANQITDNRTLVHAADTATPYDDLTGAAAGNLDTDIKIQGTGSIGDVLTDSRIGVLYDAGSAQNWANNVFYIWINCAIVGLLDTKANGGLTIRFCGATVTDFFEFYVGGSDDWPTTIEGGWAQFVVDIEATASNTGGTPPATSAIRYVGWSGITAGTMPKMVDNTFMDEIRRLPDGSPGIIVEGRNGGTTDWNSADILTQLGNATGTFTQGSGGSYVLRTPIQFGINDTTTHGFTDTNKVWLWDDQEFAPTDLYGLSALGNSGGTTNVTLGVKTGTGDDATGAQGLTIAAASTGVRWTMDFDDPDLDSINLYGCSLQHGADFQLDDPAVEVISSLYIDCSSATVSNSLQLRNKIIDANTADGVAFMTSDDMTDIKFCEFEFSDGHAVEITGTGSQTSKGNLFTGYGADATNDAAFYNNSGGSITLGITDSGDTPTVRNGASASTTIQNFVTVRVEGLTEGAAAKVIANETVGTITTGDVILQGLADSNGVVETTTFNYEAAFDPSGLDVIVRARAQGLPQAVIQHDVSVGFTDYTAEANSNAIEDVEPFSNVAVAGDAVYVGHNEEFGGIEWWVDAFTPGAGTYTLVWEYYNGAWVSLSNVVDNTNNLKNADQNKVTWTVPSDWTDTTINGQGPFRYVRGRYSAGTMTQNPFVNRLKLDVTRYLPTGDLERIITSSGLTVVAPWTPDTISTF